MDELEPQVAGATENLNASELDVRWMRAVPRPTTSDVDRIIAIFAGRRVVLGSTITAFAVLCVFGGIFVGFATFAFLAMPYRF